MSAWLDAALAHDWTGVFVNDPPDKDTWIVVTVAHHGDDAFYQLGIMDQEVTPERLFANLPKTPPHDCQDPAVDMCWMLDLHTREGVIDDREVTVDLVRGLLDVDPLEMLAIGRANHDRWIEVSP